MQIMCSISSDMVVSYDGIEFILQRKLEGPVGFYTQMKLSEAEFYELQKIIEQWEESRRAR